MRWNETVTFLGNAERYQDAAGVWHGGEPDRSEVFCNRYNRGFDESTDPDVGLREVAEVQVRKEDYSDQPRAELGGREYDVAGVSGSGEFLRVLLERRISNG